MGDSIFDLGGLISSDNINDFPSDRMNHLWAVLVFVGFTVIVSLQQYVGDPIHCWCPAEFTESHCNYTEAVCWIEDTYYIPQDEVVPFAKSDRYDEEVKYYQWVPMILLFLAACFKIPNIIWCMLNNVTGINIQLIIKEAEKTILPSSDDNNDAKADDVPMSKADSIAEYLWIRRPQQMNDGRVNKVFQLLSSCMCFCFGAKSGSYITGLYIFVKLICFAVSLGLLFILERMLAMDYMFYGWEVLTFLMAGRDLTESPRFPRITMCDFQIRQLQNIQTFSVQCVLSVNLFNEKIFIFTWFFLVFLVICNAVALLMALKNLALPQSRHQWVAEILHGHMDNNDINKFVLQLGSDVILVLRLIEDRTSEITVLDIMLKLRELFHDRINK